MTPGDQHVDGNAIGGLLEETLAAVDSDAQLALRSAVVENQRKRMPLDETEQAARPQKPRDDAGPAVEIGEPAKHAV